MIDPSGAKMKLQIASDIHREFGHSPETVAETLARRLARAYEPPVRRAEVQILSPRPG